MGDPIVMVPSPWLRGAVADLLARFDPAVVAAFSGIVVLELTVPPPGVDAERWDRCCDRCGTHVPPGPSDESTLFCGVWSPESPGCRAQIVVSYGLCRDCLEAAA